MASVALVYTAEMPRHRRLAAMHLRIVERTPQHFGAHLPRSAGAMNQGQRDTLGFDVTRGQRHDPRIIGAGQADRKVGHRTPRMVTGIGWAGSACATYALRGCCPSQAPLSAA